MYDTQAKKLPCTQNSASGPSCSHEDAKAVLEAGKKRRRKKRHHKVYVPGNSKSMRRIKRLGYTPEHNKRGYRRSVDASQEIPHVLDAGTPEVEITAEYPRMPKNQGRETAEDDQIAGRAAPRKKVFYSYTKINGKSARYLNETPEEQAARRAKYKERNRKYSEKETEEQHRQRLERRRLRRIADRLKAGHVVVSRARKALLKDIRVITVGNDEEHLETLQREYAEFNRYVTEKLQETPETQPKQLEIAYWQHEPDQINLPAETTLTTIGTNGYHNVIQKPTNAVLYSNDPVDPEIALLETSDATFVPVQVIIQTCDDFDDMLEIDENP